MKKNQTYKSIFSPASSIYILIITFLLVYAAVVLYQHFPNMYTWEELFINYEGGFIRRGLIGQLLFIANSFIPIAICYLVLYAFLFISPVIFLLPVTDRFIFGRKDLFIQIILLCIAQVCVNCLTKERANLYKHTLIISILFITGMLIHEMMIFYFPIFAVLLGVAYARQKKIFQWLCITGVLFSAALLLAVIFSGDAGTREAICASWRQSSPELTCERALRFIGTSFYANTMESFHHHLHWVTIGSFFLGACLSAIPLFFLWQAYRPYEAIRNLLSPSFVLRLAFWPAVFAPCILLIITTDYGRTVSNTFLSYIFFLYAVFSVRPQAMASWLGKLKEAISVSPRLRYGVYLFAIAYGLCWRMAHYRPPGESYIMPGVLLHLQ